MIRFSTLDVDMPPVEPQRDKAWIGQVVESYGKTVGELYYYFCSDEKLLEINRERLGHDFYTDIVTFPLTDCESVLSSEFCISIDRIKENAVTFVRSYESELHRVIIHGVLHLIGFDDLALSQFTVPALTTVQQPRFEIGEKAASMLLDMIDKKDAINSVKLKPVLVVRDSV
jgi:rRNA maturation RNase YbeY